MQVRNIDENLPWKFFTNVSLSMLRSKNFFRILFIILEMRVEKLRRDPVHFL